VIAVAVVLCMAAIFRPLLFATLDPVVASIRGVRVRLLGVVFLVLLAIVSAESTQAVGALLLLGLLAAPAGAAHRMTVRPGRGLALSGLIAVGSMWGGLALAYAIPALPPSSAIVALAAGSYGAAAMFTRDSGAGRRSGRRAMRGPDRRRPA
jgi:zinc/manganese transport system permease protein